MKETDFYPVLGQRFQRELLAHLPEESKVVFAMDAFLPDLLRTVKNELNEELDVDIEQMPKLKLDILIGVKVPDRSPNMIIVEVKYLEQLSLAHYSQMVGYLQVQKKIRFGILALVAKAPASSMLSSDFSTLIQMKNLVTEWEMITRAGDRSDSYFFNTAICRYTPNNGIDWMQPHEPNAIGCVEQLVLKLLESS